jgi:uncharacterized membrane protein
MGLYISRFCGRTYQLSHYGYLLLINWVHIWKQCNKWRERISEISRGHDSGFTLEQLEFKERIQRGYLWVYSAMVVAFVSAISLVLILQAYSEVVGQTP